MNGSNKIEKADVTPIPNRGMCGTKTLQITPTPIIAAYLRNRIKA
jgi:hypothetical protein